eukprot:5676236-Pyramimonas_sp.AAC.2
MSIGQSDAQARLPPGGGLQRGWPRWTTRDWRRGPAQTCREGSPWRPASKCDPQAHMQSVGGENIPW